MDLLLEADDSLEPFNIVEALVKTLTAHHRAVCAWENRNRAAAETDPTAHIEIRPGIMEIQNEWENIPDLVQFFQGMRVAIGNRAGSYNGILHTNRVTMSSCLKLMSPKAAGHIQGASEDGSRKQKREPHFAQMEAERNLLFDKNDAVMQHLVWDYDARWAKFLI